MIEIKTYNELTSKQVKSVEDIFFETSARTEFTSEEEKENFIYQYLGYYYNKYPEYFLVALKENNVLGYICASPNSNQDHYLMDNLPHFSHFKAYYDEFPAHLHINMSKDSQGLGIGSQLIMSLENLLGEEKGLHLITTPGAKNRNFYQKNGYLSEFTEVFKGKELLLMGKNLSC